MSDPAPLRHYYAPEDGHEGAACHHGRAAGHVCARPKDDPVHLTPGDDDAYHDAIRAASPHSEPQRTPEQDEAALARAKARGERRAGRYTFGALRERPRAPREAG